MDSTLKVTDQSEEIAFDDMVGGDQIINIPLFQRSYKWTDKNLSEFWDDVTAILDESSLSQFLGVLVLVPQSRKVGQPFFLDVVDGQQRLSTCYLTALATVFTAAKNSQPEWAIEAARSYLLTRKFSTLSTNTKLIPSAIDRQQFVKIWSQLINLPSMRDADWNGNPPSPPSPSGSENGRMFKAFKKLVRLCNLVYEDQGFAGIERIFEIAIRKLSFVTINLRNPTAAPAIFERLNARGERINISDLVRNEIFAKVAHDPMLAKSIFESSWEPFIKKFSAKNVEFEKLLFPYGLTFNSNITKADLFQALRAEWGENSTPQDIINAMDEYTPELFALEAGDTSEIQHPDYATVIYDLHLLGAPSSIYPFVFQLTKAIDNEEVDPLIGTKALRLIESFLFRRSIAGIEPTGLHAVFKGLWEEAGASNLSEDKVRRAIGRRTTVPWPNNEEFKKAIERNSLYGKRSDKYALLQFELHVHGETPEDEFQIEHIYPKHPSKEWEIRAGDYADSHKDMWGNLIPITSTMNPEISNSTFEVKKEEYEDSIFATTRNLARETTEWTLESIKSRNKSIAAWAVNRWPHQRGH